MFPPSSSLLAPQPDSTSSDYFSAMVKPGSFSERVLEAARRLKTHDATAVADDLDLKTQGVAMTLSRLAKGGYLEGIA